MMLDSPTFEDATGFFAGRNLETTFEALNAGLERIRSKVGETRYGQLVELSRRMRRHFEADPEDKTEDSIEGRRLIGEMERILARKK